MYRLLALLMLSFLWLPVAAEQSPADTRKPAPQVVLSTSMGDITLTLLPEKAPVTVANFLDYVDSGFYDNTLLHRVIPGFVIQGGGFDANMRRKATRAPIKNESGNGLANRRGTLAMARMAAPDSATSQFFINLRDNPSLNASFNKPGYAVFARITEGMDVADRIARVETGSFRHYRDMPREPVLILSAQRKPQ